MGEFPLGMRFPERFGRYLLLDRIGGGGMAAVYRATFSAEGGFEKEVALKVIRSELSEDPQFISMFLDEARLSGALSHPNIVQTFDFGQVDGIYFIAMELIRGKTLAAILASFREKGVRLGLAASLFVAKDLARALDYAHRSCDAEGQNLRIVHRDVSPQNILISREGDVKLVDFGIAKAALRSQVTQPGRVRGKCSYMAPEQARGLDVDAKADVFALGSVLWECLTGRRLFDGPSDATVLLQVIEKEIPPPSAYVPEIDSEVDDVVLRLLHRDPARRPESGQAMRELADLSFRLARSPDDLDLTQLQQRLATASAAVSKPEIDLTEWNFSVESKAESYPWPIDPSAKTMIPNRETNSIVREEVETVVMGSGETETRVLGPSPDPSRSIPGKAKVTVAVAAGIGAFLGIVAMGSWNLWFASNGEDPSPAEVVGEGEVRSAGALAMAPGPSEPHGEEAEDEEQEAAPVDEAADRIAMVQEEEASQRVAPEGQVETAAGSSKIKEGPEVARQLVAERPTKAREAPAAPRQRPRPPSPPPPQPEAVEGLIILSTRLSGATVSVGGGAPRGLMPHAPLSLSLPEGERRLVFRHEEEGISCKVRVQIEGEERVALLFDLDGVGRLQGAKRQPLPCL